jgi:hypothetical protein
MLSAIIKQNTSKKETEIYYFQLLLFLIDKDDLKILLKTTTALQANQRIFIYLLIYLYSPEYY